MSAFGSARLFRRAVELGCLSIFLCQLSPMSGMAQTPDQNTSPKAGADKTAPQSASEGSAKSAGPAATAKSVRDLPPGPRAWEILKAGLAFNSTEKRAKAVTALGILKGHVEAEKSAIAALKDGSPEVRAAAANTLGTMKAARSRSALEAALDDKDPSVVLAAANSLMILRDANFAYDVYYGVLTGTMRTNANPLKAQVKDQLKILHDKKKIAELGLEQGVGFIPYGGIGYGVVKTMVKNDNSAVRAVAAKKLAHDPDPVSAEALVNATHDKSWTVRAAALEAIAERGDPSLLSKIIDAMDDDKDEVRFSGAACVARLSGLKKRRSTAESITSAAAN